MTHRTPSPSPLSALLRVPGGPVRIADFDPRATPGFPGGGKKEANRLRQALAPELSEWQELLFANGRSRPEEAPRVLVVLQGMDTSGKGGVIRHAIGLVDPQGVDIHSFKAPTARERAHHYLWRIERALPMPGMIGIFDRSHYEDVLVARVEELVPGSELERRYDQINGFEGFLTEQGYTIIKCFLHISADEQQQRLASRLERPEKHWKYNPGDLVARSKWDAYVTAYEAALERCSTDVAPWYIVPSDRKWYRNWAVAELLREKLAGLGLTWPSADFDVADQRRLVAEA
ncbi:MAG: PPK2 family polyphosphate kinase [Propioniciclava sp.]